jgi:hypothetical protein
LQCDPRLAEQLRLLAALLPDQCTPVCKPSQRRRKRQSIRAFARPNIDMFLCGRYRPCRFRMPRSKPYFETSYHGIDRGQVQVRAEQIAAQAACGSPHIEAAIGRTRLHLVLAPTTTKQHRFLFSRRGCFRPLPSPQSLPHANTM